MTDYKYSGVVIYQSPQEQEVFRNELKKVRKMLDAKEFEGVVAEVGVFQGGTAKIIREEINEPLYLFDTFSGFPDEIDESDPKDYKPGMCKTDETFVTNLMKDEKDVVITKGIFPDTANIIKDKKFVFVHLDVDTYNGTKNALEFFYPKMVIGGTIIVHDYPAHSGIKKYIDAQMDRMWTEREWEIKRKDPIVLSGGRQLIIYRRVPELTL